MAQVQLNEDGTFSSIVGDTDVTDMTYEEIQEVVEEQETVLLPSDQITDEGEITDVLETTENILDDMGVAAVEDSEESEVVENSYPADYSVMPLSAVDTDYTYSPTAWQLNLAAERGLGEHYLMYGSRTGSGSYNGYWDYYLVLGDDIEYNEASDRYTYTDCDVYHHSTYDGVVTYERMESSGTISGSSQVVYSDLYFDYVGVDPVENSYPYISFALFMIMIVLLIVGGRKNV